MNSILSDTEYVVPSKTVSEKVKKLFGTSVYMLIVEYIPLSTKPGNCSI